MTLNRLNKKIWIAEKMAFFLKKMLQKQEIAAPLCGFRTLVTSSIEVFVTMVVDRWRPLTATTTWVFWFCHKVLIPLYIVLHLILQHGNSFLYPLIFRRQIFSKITLCLKVVSFICFNEVLYLREHHYISAEKGWKQMYFFNKTN